MKPIKKNFNTLILYLLIGVLNTSFSHYQEKKQSLKDQVAEKEISPKDLKIYIEKSKRQLSVYFKKEKLISYPCVLGFSPEGDKMKQGDGKTPEGEFKIKSKYAHKSWSYFIWIDYPNSTSWKKFKERKKKGELSKSDKIGGEIGIHGVPEDGDILIDSKVDWTLGCISLKTADITDLYHSISQDTKIEIVK